jgi:hypothetical protein
MNAIATPLYTQADLAADIEGIDVACDDIVIRIQRVRTHWADVQSFHPGVSADEYIRTEVPYLNRNTAAAVALVQAGAMTNADAARLVGMTAPGLRKARSRGTSNSGASSPTTKPVTLTGKTATGPAIGTPSPVTKRKEKKPPVAITTPPIVLTDEWDKTLSAMSVILSAKSDHILAAINAQPQDKRVAASRLFRSTAQRLNLLRQGVDLT